MLEQIQRKTAALWTESLSDDQYRAFGQRYFDDPVAFAEECVLWNRSEGEGITPYQREIMEALVEFRRVSARGPRGLGKTMFASLMVWWFALTRDALELDWKIATTASNNRQLNIFLWPEIHKWGRKINWMKVGRAAPDEKEELTTKMLKLKTGRAYAVASDSAEATEGGHADHMFYLFDEAKSIPDAMWDSAEGALVKKNALALAVSTPGVPAGRFYDIQSNKPEYARWWKRFVTLQEAVDAGRIEPEWANDRLLEWGEMSALYQNHVLGNFAQDEEDVLIPLWWVEAAVERYYERLVSDSHDLTLIDQIGLDVARMGGDATVLAKRSGYTILPLEAYGKQSTMQTAGLPIPYLRNDPNLMVQIDIVGLGAGVYDRVTEQFEDSENILPFHPQEKTDFRDGSELWEFQDVYSAAWWYVRELLDPNNPRKVDELLALPPDSKLPAELTGPMWNINSAGKIVVERKEKVKERLGHSPDRADAIVMACWGGGVMGIEFG